MRLCIPIARDYGLESSISGHFGSAPMFLFVDSETGECETTPNRSTHDRQGGCRPLDSLTGRPFGALVVSGIGPGALNRMMQAGIPVYLSQHLTVEEALEAFKSGLLQEVEPGMVCGNHRSGTHGHGCRDRRQGSD